MVAEAFMLHERGYMGAEPFRGGGSWLGVRETAEAKRTALIIRNLIDDPRYLIG
jgi:hypothetical protein